MPKIGNVYTIPFGRSGMVSHPNRWLTQAGDLAVAQNVTFENDMLQKEPAANHYDVTGLAIEAPNGNFKDGSNNPFNTDSTFAAIWLPASSGATFGAQVAASVVSTTSPWSPVIGA